MKPIITTILLTFSTFFNMNGATVIYEIEIFHPQAHYATVSMELGGVNDKFVDFKMPVWTPGSYMIREFERNVEQFRALDSKGKKLEWSKVSKNTWRVNNTKGNNTIKIVYDVYAFEYTVRTSFIDFDHAFLHNTSIFMFAENYQNTPGKLVLKSIPSHWPVVSTGLEKENDKTYLFDNYDILADSPIEIGNQEVVSFEVMGVPHYAALVGISDCDKEKLAKDLKKICETTAAIIGEMPCKSYTFIIQNVEKGGGGLEHLNSTTVQMQRWSYGKQELYNNFLGLCAHEYFHLWNVKRLRPEPLGPFNYSEENYTRLLWVAEGITAYYDQKILLRAGYWKKEQYLSALAKEIEGTENKPGNLVQSLELSSFDAWIKAYRPDENSNNTSISYYTKGTVVAALLDIMIIDATGGKKSLDEVMKQMYTTFYTNKNRPFTTEEFEQTVTSIAGKDFKPFFDIAIRGTGSLSYKEIFALAGIEYIAKTDEKTAWMGLNTKQENGKTIVTSIVKESPAWYAGINVNDEIIGIQNIRTDKGIDSEMRHFKPDEKVEVFVSRSGFMRVLPVVLRNNPAITVVLKIAEQSTTEKQEKTLKKWLE